MELLCPECLNQLESSGNSMVRCPTHGGQYQALYVRADGYPLDSREAEGTGSPCIIHPSASASTKCMGCAADICSTCTFSFPGVLRLCPDCATKPPEGPNATQKTLLYTSYGFALWTTLGIVALFSGIFAPLIDDPEQMPIFLLVFQYLIFSPALIGPALAIGATEKNSSTTPAIWISIVWNSLLAMVLVLLEIAGRMME